MIISYHFSKIYGPEAEAILFAQANVLNEETCLHV